MTLRGAYIHVHTYTEPHLKMSHKPLLPKSSLQLQKQYRNRHLLEKESNYLPILHIHHHVWYKTESAILHIVRSKKWIIQVVITILAKKIVVITNETVQDIDNGVYTFLSKSDRNKDCMLGPGHPRNSGWLVRKDCYYQTGWEKGADVGHPSSVAVASWMLAVDLP